MKFYFTAIVNRLVVYEKLVGPITNVQKYAGPITGTEEA